MGSKIAGFDIGFNLPQISTSGWGFWVTIIAIIILVLIVIGVLVWVYLQRRVYNIQIRDFENISGQGFQFVRRNTARLVKIGDGGEELLMMRKGKTFRTAYGRKMGRNEYWFAKGQDGYWYNIVLGDLDAKMGMLDIEPIDRDMRYMHVAIRKNIQDRYKKKEGFEKYVPYIIQGFMIIMIIIWSWLMISKAGDQINVATQNLEATKPIAEALTNAISKFDSICASSGIRPA